MVDPRTTRYFSTYLVVLSRSTVISFRNFNKVAKAKMVNFYPEKATLYFIITKYELGKPCERIE